MIYLLASLLCVGRHATIPAPCQRPVETSASQLALQRLMEGNARFVAGKSQYTYAGGFQKEMSQMAHEPFAVVLCCSDARVPPEILFDRGIGDTFVVRVAGNIAGPLEMESIRFAVDALKAPLVLVLAHEDCGAVKAAMQDLKGAKVDMPEIASYIRPAIKNASKLPGVALVDAIQLNALAVQQQLLANPALLEFVQRGKLVIVAGYFDFTTGRVTLLD